MTADARTVPLCDLARQAAQRDAEVMAAIRRVTLSGRYILGQECEQFEAAFANALGVKHAVSCASGSDALLIALLATGIGPGDEVLVPDFTFFATAAAVSRTGARPVFVDIEPQHLTLDPNLLAANVTPKTKAILPVHLFGNAANLPALRAFCDEHQLLLIEDAAQAFGTTFDGRPVGTWGDAGCFSFFPTKNLGALGDGGMLATNSAAIAAAARQLRVHGRSARHRHERIGLNSRLDALQAAILAAKLPHWPESKARRQVLAERYTSGLRPIAAAGWIQLPLPMPNSIPAWNIYALQVAEAHRDSLRDFLQATGIQTEIYYPLTLQQQPCYTAMRQTAEGSPAAEKATRTSLAIPLFPELTFAEQDYVVEGIAKFFEARAP